MWSIKGWAILIANTKGANDFPALLSKSFMIKEWVKGIEPS